MLIPARLTNVDAAVRAGDLAWHALPLTTHTELLDAQLFRAGLGIGRELDRRFDRTTTAAKMTDVPGHTRSMVPLLAEAGAARIALPYLPTGWTRDALWPDLAPLAAEGRVVTLLGDLDRATWPLAKAGFFGVAKAIEDVLAQCGIRGPSTRD